MTFPYHNETDWDCIPAMWLHGDPKARPLGIWIDSEGVFHSEIVDLDQRECALCLMALFATLGNIDRAIENAKHAKLNKTVAALEKVKDATDEEQAR